MTEEKTPHTQSAPSPYDYPPHEMEDDEISLVDLVYPIFKRRRFLISFVFIIVIIVGAYISLTTKTYEAKAVILPETREPSGGAGELKAVFMEKFGIAGLGEGSNTPAEMFEAILKSKELAHAVLRRSGGYFVHGTPNKGQDRASQNLSNSIQASNSNENPSMSIRAQAHHPVWAADISNSYVLALDAYNRENTITSARRLRKYVESRLETANQELELAQKDLRNFQEENQAISISKQAEATLNVLSKMEARRVELEVQKAAKEKFYKGSHIEIEQTVAQMEALQRNINRLTYSEEPEVPVEIEEGRVEFYIPLTRIPALAFDESRLLLEVESKTKIVTMLITHLEQAKLDETKDMPTINVLDSATPPEIAAKPKIKLIILLSIIAALFVGIIIIFFIEFSQRIEQDPDTGPKWKEIKSAIRPFKKR